MTLWITGENGFIARALVRHLGHKYSIENSHLNDNYDYWRQNYFKKYHHKEIDVFDPTLKTMIERSEVDCIIHTAIIIEEDDKSHKMIRQNIEGSYYIAQIAKELNIPVILIQYDHHINDTFMWTQHVILDMFKSMGVKFTQINTDELFGPEDFYGPISQLLMSSVGKIDQAQFKADLSVQQNYTFIDDFLDGLDVILTNLQLYKNKTISIKNDEMKSLEDVIDYMTEVMELTVAFDIKEVSSSVYTELTEIELESWKCKIPFEAALEITRDLINDRARK